MQRTLLRGCLAACLWGCGGGGEVVAVKLVQPNGTPNDPNPNGYFLCPRAEADPPTFACQGGQQFHQYDRVVEAGAPCEYGIASIYVETSGSGHVKHLQYACALAPVTPFPADSGSSAAVSAPAPVPAVDAPVSASPAPGGQ
jgi:hypothetical protein